MGYDTVPIFGEIPPALYWEIIRTFSKTAPFTSVQLCSLLGILSFFSIRRQIRDWIGLHARSVPSGQEALPSLHPLSVVHDRWEIGCLVVWEIMPDTEQMSDWHITSRHHLWRCFFSVLSSFPLHSTVDCPLPLHLTIYLYHAIHVHHPNAIQLISSWPLSLCTDDCWLHCVPHRTDRFCLVCSQCLFSFFLTFWNFEFELKSSHFLQHCSGNDVTVMTSERGNILFLIESSTMHREIPKTLCIFLPSLVTRFFVRKLGFDLLIKTFSSKPWFHR